MSSLQNRSLYVKWILNDAANAFIVTSAWPVEKMNIGKHFKLTRKQVKISRVLLKSKASRNCRRQNWLKACREISALGVD